MIALQRTFLALFLLFLSLPLAAAELAQRLDAIAAKQFKDNEPGAAVLVAKAGTPLLRKGYGMADLEQGTKIVPENVFRLGSITKQFTAVAVLQLVESGKIALGDPITKFFSDYPTHGKTVTVEHLLTHTSGIPSYTEKSEFRKRRVEDLKPEEIIAAVRDDPSQFDPGTKFAYNNSGYILLGMLIEKVAGMPYAEYLEKNVYPRAGLTSTRYGDTRPIVPGRVPGYSRAAGKVVNADYVSMTVPYAAGALLSTVDDLARWTAAVAAGNVVDRSLIDKAWTPYRLASGEDAGYGYGWRRATVAAERVIQHGGSIQGFSTYAMWMPAHEVFVAILANDQTVDPDFTAGLLALEAIGKPWYVAEVAATPEELSAYAGVYRFDDKSKRTVIAENGKLYSQREGGRRFELFRVGKDQFRFRETFSTITFERDAANQIAAMTFDSGSTKTRGAKTDEKPVERTAIAIDPARLDRYTGKYQLSPTSGLTITRKNDTLWASPGPQREIQLFPESEARWFAKEVDIVLVFAFDAAGKANGITMIQGGRERELKRIE